mmetsp:Transcript_99091/g.196422  ORF Transcript_99091/g.196422 Transcript_99091/m.196422 type:complete len:84 (-) Transcript_99091:302-553(-)
MFGSGSRNEDLIECVSRWDRTFFIKINIVATLPEERADIKHGMQVAFFSFTPAPVATLLLAHTKQLAKIIIQCLWNWCTVIIQ